MMQTMTAAAQQTLTAAQIAAIDAQTVRLLAAEHAREVARRNMIAGLADALATGGGALIDATRFTAMAHIAELDLDADTVEFAIEDRTRFLIARMLEGALPA
jgi:hypothetical protein